MLVATTRTLTFPALAPASALVKEYDITPQHLRAFGVGFLAPVASNPSEEGRAKNRRIDLLPQWIVCARLLDRPVGS
jgi:hypothetical protein